MLEILQQCTIHGNVVKLPPGTLDRKLYQDVAKALQGIGGKWNKKSDGFVFPHDPTEHLAKIQGGVKVNLQKEFQAFYTPKELAEEIAWHLFMPRTGQVRVLEPSAGRGALVKAVLMVNPDAVIDVYELNPLNRPYLDALPNVTFLAEDFLAHESGAIYDYIIANPPFAGNADIDHFCRMYEHLSPGGRMAVIMSKHWQISDGRKEKAFLAWLEQEEAEISDIPPGAFKESGTNVATCLVILDK